MKKIYFIVTAVFSFSTLLAQTTDLGGPIGWKNKLDERAIPLETMPGFDLAAVQAEDAINDQHKDQPWRFGYKYQVNYSLSNSGNWTTLPNGGRVWQLAVECPDAMTINLLLDNYNLPAGAHLYLYDWDQTNRVGAYTNRNNRDDGILGTELVHGEKIIVEYYEPANVVGQGSFTITDVVHGYRSLNPIQNELTRALNSSGDCNIDVNCPLGSGWSDQIRSVAMIVVNGSGICTGALINNTCDDGTPYFLTANHCLGGNTSSWAFRFNWESPAGSESCATTASSVDPGPPYDETANGATVLTSGGVSDFALLEIDNMTLTDAQTWNCFYAGWDNSDALTVTQATGIHHPSGDVKKICRENNAPYHSNTAGADVWWIDDWDQGVTEPGSSGSPLFDQNGRIIGQLYGGLAACQGTTDNNDYDYYGRFGVSWVNGVSTYLGGSCGTSTTNDGYDPNSPTLADDAGITAVLNPQGQYCTDNFDPVVTLRNYGTNDLTSVTINYDIDAGPNNTFSWTGTLTPGSTVDVTLPNLTTTGGSHTFNAYTTLPNGNIDSDASNDAASGSYSAVVGGEDITLELNTDCWGSEVTWEIVDNSSTVMASGGPYTDVTGGETIIENFCLATDCYDFVINDSYGDGMYGSQWGCAVDGNYFITQDASGDTLASIQAANSDYGNQEINNFCVASPCSGSLSSSSTDVSCFGDNDGSLSVTVTGGNAPFTYDIGSGSQGSNSFTNLSAGTYTVTVVDNNSCSNTIDVTINEPAQLTSSSTVTDETCAGSNDGQIDVAATGGTTPYTYDIGSGGQSSSNFNGLSPNTYNLTVTDDNGCTVSENNLVIGSGTGVTATTTVTDISCNGQTDGQITVNTTNGTAPFTFDIGSGPQTSNSFTNLSAGSHTIDITDDNGCTGQVTGTVNDPAALGGTYTTTDELSGNDGAIDLTVTGGTAPYTYSWTGPNSFTSTVEDPSALTQGLYNVTITDANGCTFTITDIEINSSVGFEENEISLTVYPNPSSGLFVVSVSNISSQFKLDILDVTGRVIYTDNIVNSTKHEIDLSSFAAGSYFLRIEMNGYRKSTPIVISK